MNDETRAREPGEAALSAEEARAREALRRAPGPRLDELDRRRLVRRAMTAPAPRARPWRWIAAAAVVVTVVGAVALLRPGGGEDTTAQPDAARVEEPAASEGELDDAALEESPREALIGFEGLRHLGDFDTDEELLAVIPGFAAQGQALARDADVGAHRCADVLDRQLLTGDAALATYQGLEVLVVVRSEPDTDPAVYLVDLATCDVLDGWAPRRL